MGYNRLYVAIVTRVLLLMITATLLLWVLLFYPTFRFTIAFLILTIPVQLWFLLRQIGKIFQELDSYANILRETNHPVKLIQKKKNPALRQLYQKFEEVNSSIAAIRIEKESQRIFLETLVKQVATGILAFDEKGIVRLSNPAAINLLRAGNLLKISDLQRVDENLYQAFAGLKPGKNHQVTLQRLNEQITLCISAEKMISDRQTITLCSFYNIEDSLQQKEAESWQRLTRVLCHEIMNSVAPITSVSQTLADILDTTDYSPEQLTLEMKKGLSLISRRGAGLKEFVERFRTLAPNCEMIISETNLSELLTATALLMKPEFDRRLINLMLDIPPTPIIANLDSTLIEQVIVNLLKNAMEAAHHKVGIVKLWLTQNQQTNEIQFGIDDNGDGIPKHDQEKIFIPFYTTKEKGSGIGLTFSRLIINRHGGNLNVWSEQGKGTRFYCTIPRNSINTI